MSDLNKAFRDTPVRSHEFRAYWEAFHQSIGPLLAVAVACFALVTCGSVALALLGLAPWLEVDASFGGTTIEHAGIWLQSIFAALTLLIALYLPTHARVARLEKSHRSFQIGMEDVARAYRLAHEEDRKGAFTLSGEFDAMRERLNHMRRHPDLAALEAELLELAAQMSLQSRDLAKIYSDEKVARAKAFLAQRQQEAQATEDKIRIARYACDEIRNWLTDVEADERRLSSQFQMLERDLKSVLPSLGYELEDPREANVVQLTKPTK
ncbi:DNA repair protein [Albirhodobacter sp. R86504]|uniref:DNA repair protein n=1 Tax=Albirhodobacter sp. R86504 TaxID=3093848 RepID=UPI00366BE6D4